MGTSTPIRPAPDGPLARAVHDMRGPLTVIRGLCDILERGEPCGDRRRRLRAIDAEALRLVDALDGLLAPGPAPHGPLDLAGLAAAAVERHRWAASGRAVRLTLRAPDRPMVAGDAAAIARAIDNLIGNALRHCAAAGRVRVLVSVRGRWAHLCVRDDGAGVPEADREAIFLPGHRGSAPRGPGRGLGLAIARDIALAHGGGLTLDRVGAGASFRMALPCAEAADEPGVA